MSARDPSRLKILEQQVRALAIEDGLWGAAEALAQQAGVANKPTRRHDASQFPFITALDQHLSKMDLRYGSLLEGAPDPMFVTDHLGVIVFANDRAAKQLGYEPGELLGRKISAAIDGQLPSQIITQGAATMAPAILEHAGLPIELTAIRKDDSRFAVEAMLSLLESEQGILVTVAIRDLSGRRAREKSLVSAEAQSRSLFDAGPDGIIVINRRGRITVVNARTELLFGYEHDALAARAATVLLPAEIVDRIVASIGTGDQSAMSPITAKGRRQNGADLPIEIAVSSMVTEAGRVAIASIRDLTRPMASSIQTIGSEATEIHRQMLDAVSDVVVAVDQLGNIAFLNEAAARKFGYGRDELLGKSIVDLLPQGLSDRVTTDSLFSAEVALAHELGATIDMVGRTKDGRSIALEAMLTILDMSIGTLTVAILRDPAGSRPAQRSATSSDREKASQAKPVADVLGDESKVVEELAESALRSIGDAIVCANSAGIVGFMNDAAETLTGWSAKAALGHPLAEVVRLIEGSSRVQFFDESACDSRAAQLHSNFVLVRPDQTEIPIEGSIAPISARDGQPIGEVLVFRDVSLAQAKVQQMAHSAQHDALTGLPNRVLLNDRISSAISIAPRHHKKVAILFLDLDGFKQINDSLGHAAGDKLLQSVAGRLLGCVRGSDTVSRLGGDEFVVLLSEVERPEDSAITARRMLDAIAATFTIDQHELHITGSIGVSAYPEDGSTAESLIKSADAAMYQVKESGRHGYQFYKPAMNLRAIEQREVEDALRHALQRDEFALHFQPKVNLQTGQISGAEALLRWNHPTRGPVSPALFVPVAEGAGLIHEIGNWVIREACRQTQVWIASGLSMPSISVNVSAVEFWGAHFTDGVFEALNSTGLDPRVLELELTERVLTSRMDDTNSILQGLSASGVRMSVDDFGTGHSSLSDLRKFPITSLKIDQSFVREITLAGDQTSIVAAVLSMAESLNLRIVAEGVETSAELEFLQHHHCHEAQGFYFSKPLPAAQFSRLLRDGLIATMAAREYGRPTDHWPARRTVN